MKIKFPGSGIRSGWVAVTLAGVFAAATAQAWGPGVHSYVAEQVNKKAGWKNVNEMYGGMAPDIINYMFSSPYLGKMFFSTHKEANLVFEAAKTQPEKTVALGFLTHNELFGADSTAHYNSLTLDPTRGYSVQKAEILAGMIKSDPGYAALGIPDAITLEVCHSMVESAVDLIMAQAHPNLGTKMVQAAQGRSASFPKLLAKAYAQKFAPYFEDSPEAAAQALMEAEALFQWIVTEQGKAFQQDFETALDLLSEQNAIMAAGFLSQFGVELPPGVELKPIAVNLTLGGIAICKDDAMQEVEATVKAVKANMKAEGYRFPQY